MDQTQHYQSMSISLPPDLIRMIQEKVEDGLYASENDVIEVALRSMKSWSDAHQKYIHEQLMIGIDQADRGLLVDLYVVRSEF